MVKMTSSAVDADDADKAEVAFKPLSREEAQKLREASPQLAPWVVLAGQLAVGVLLACAAWALTGRQNVAWSVFYGALVVVIPGALFARGLASKLWSMNPGAAVAGFFLWEMVKIAASVGMLFAAPQLVAELDWLAMLVGLMIVSGAPGRFQAAVEILFEMVDAQAKAIVHNAASRKMVAPLALTVFVWIFLLNAMDLLPVDLLPMLWSLIYGAAGHDPSHAYLRVVPTADLSVTMGLSVSVLFICLFYNIKVKGLGGWAHELVCAPFGTSKNPIFALILGLANLAMQLIEFVAKTVSHGMRLFGNMYAGELVFMLIALLGGAWAFSLEPAGLMLLLLHIVAGWAWAVFHILIIILQAFVFMMLTLVYIGQAHDAH